jgi:DnaJ-class molecular chaperone
LDDPYKTLGLSRDATADDIRKAYRKLAKTHHPDLNPGNKKAEETFKAVASANEILSDPVKRAKFDSGEIDAAGNETPRQPRYQDYAAGAAGRRYSTADAGASWGGDGEDIEDMFSQMFGARRAGARAQSQDERYALQAAFIDAMVGATRRLTLPDGRVLDVKIPAGSQTGDTLRLRGQGPGGGDALIEITVTPHRFFTRDGNDIRVTLPVSLSEAVLGGTVDTPTPAGRVRLRIPPDSDTGTELRLRGRGVSALGATPAGDLYVTLRVQIGKADQALQDFLKGWSKAQKTDPREGMEVP